MLAIVLAGSWSPSYAQGQPQCTCFDLGNPVVGADLDINLIAGPNDPGGCCWQFRLSNTVASGCQLPWPNEIRISPGTTTLPLPGWPPTNFSVNTPPDWSATQVGPDIIFTYTGLAPGLNSGSTVPVGTICWSDPVNIGWFSRVDFGGCQAEDVGFMNCTPLPGDCPEECYWTINGNNNTDGTNFLGNNNPTDLVIGTGGTDRLRILDDGRVWINRPAGGFPGITPQAQVDIVGDLALSNPPPFGRKILTGSDTRLNLHLNTDANNSTSWIELNGFDQGNNGALSLAGDRVNLLFGSDGSNTSQVGQTGLLLDNNGFVGIGTGSASTPPIAQLDVRGNNIFLGGAGTSGFVSRFASMGESGNPGECNLFGFRAQTAADQFINMGLISGAPTISWGETHDLEFLADNGPGCGTLVMRLHSPRSIGGNPNVVMEVFGSALATSMFINSDRRMKDGVEGLESSLEVIRKLNGVSYEMRSEAFPSYHFQSGRQLGFIAQDVQSVLPELVLEQEDGYLAVNYDGVIPVLVEAVKELDERQESQSNQAEAIANLQAQNLALMERLADLEVELNQMCASGCAGLERPAPALQGARLEQNVPNPFHRQTTIAYFLPEGTQNASLKVSFLNGKVWKVVELSAAEGEGFVVLNTDGLSDGTYVYSLLVNGVPVATRKMVLDQ